MRSGVRAVAGVLLLGGLALLAPAVQANGPCLDGSAPVLGGAYTVCLLAERDTDTNGTHAHTNTPASADVLVPINPQRNYVGDVGVGVTQETVHAAYPGSFTYDTRMTRAEADTFGPYTGSTRAGVMQYKYEVADPPYFDDAGRFTAVYVQNYNVGGVSAAEYAYGPGAPCQTDARVELFYLGIAAPSEPCPVEVPQAPDFPEPPL